MIAGAPHPEVCNAFGWPALPSRQSTSSNTVLSQSLEDVKGVSLFLLEIWPFHGGPMGIDLLLGPASSGHPSAMEVAPWLARESGCNLPSLEGPYTLQDFGRCMDLPKAFCRGTLQIIAKERFLPICSYPHL